jgi:hypothetical protein
LWPINSLLRKIQFNQLGARQLSKGHAGSFLDQEHPAEGDHTGTQVQQKETTRDLFGEDGILCCVYSDRGTFETVLKIGKLVM